MKDNRKNSKKIIENDEKEKEINEKANKKAEKEKIEFAKANKKAEKEKKEIAKASKKEEKASKKAERKQAVAQRNQARKPSAILEEIEGMFGSPEFSVDDDIIE